MSFTKGPWTINQAPRGRYYITAPNAVAVCETFEPGQSMARLTGAQMPLHDAALIAAAPDLYAALDAAESFVRGFEGDELQEGIDDLLDQMRLALARAIVRQGGEG